MTEVIIAMDFIAGLLFAKPDGEASNFDTGLYIYIYTLQHIKSHTSHHDHKTKSAAISITHSCITSI